MELERTTGEQLLYLLQTNTARLQIGGVEPEVALVDEAATAFYIKYVRNAGPSNRKSSRLLLLALISELFFA